MIINILFILSSGYFVKRETAQTETPVEGKPSYLYEDL